MLSELLELYLHPLQFGVTEIYKEEIKVVMDSNMVVHDEQQQLFAFVTTHEDNCAGASEHPFAHEVSIPTKQSNAIQDRVPAFSPKKARAFIKSELGAPVDIIFKEFEDQPIAAASLGQVFDPVSFLFT